jgi:hypothetical protein
VGAEALRALDLREAVDMHGALGKPLAPATLHPAYVAADASRNAALEPVYLAFEKHGERWLHSLHVARIAGTDLRDASSPYGYGGPLSSTDDPRFIAQAWQAYAHWMTSQRVVVEYVRFHPALGNERYYGGTVSDNRTVVWMDLQTQDIATAYATRLRQSLKKASGAGLVYRECPLASRVREFGAFYRSGMAQIGADPFFFFDDAYFALLADSGLASLGICQHRDDSEGRWLAASLFLDGQGLREYHLSATNAQGRGLAAPSFVLHEAALSARRLGLRRLYLGGGSDVRPDNPLLFFKSAFSTERLCYRTGSAVFRSSDYAALQQRFAPEWKAHPERPIFYRKV